MHKLCDRQNKKIKRGYGIAQHGKGEVDHVGGIAKNTTRKAVKEGKLFRDAHQIRIWEKIMNTNTTLKHSSKKSWLLQ